MTFGIWACPPDREIVDTGAAGARYIPSPLPAQTRTLPAPLSTVTVTSVLISHRHCLGKSRRLPLRPVRRQTQAGPEEKAPALRGTFLSGPLLGLREAILLAEIPRRRSAAAAAAVAASGEGGMRTATTMGMCTIMITDTVMAMGPFTASMEKVGQGEGGGGGGRRGGRWFGHNGRWV